MKPQYIVLTLLAFSLSQFWEPAQRHHDLLGFLL